MDGSEQGPGVVGVVNEVGKICDSRRFEYVTLAAFNVTVPKHFK